MKSAFVAVIGRPSAGKSTLINRMCGRKISIVSSSPQTTRNKVRGVLTTGSGQLVFVDTPGFHTSDRRLNLHLRQLVTSCLEEVDLVLYVVDSSRSHGPEEQALCSLISEDSARVVVALNKVDIVGNGVNERQSLLQGLLPSAAFHRISATEGTGVEGLLQELFDRASDDDPMYPEEFYTDQEPSFRVAEVIREKAVTRLRQELPHSLYVEVEDMELAPDESSLWVRAVILVERESQKGMVVGRKGSVIGAIRKDSLAEFKEIFPYHVDLDLRVKVHKDWRKKEELLRRLIF